MAGFEFDSNAYLRRINLEVDIQPTIACLEKIHQAQHRTIPFENFDIALGRSINLSPEAVFNKLVMSRRGGYCFEVNTLLHQALAHFGFECRPLLGRVHVTGEATGRGHLIVLVTIEGRQWIVDTGFGADTPAEPVPFITDREVITRSGQALMLVEDPCYGFMLKIRKEHRWVNLYSFDLTCVCEGDIDYGNYYTSSHPSSVFVFARVAALPLENGMVTLFNHRVKQYVNGETIEWEPEPGPEYIEAINKLFNIELDAAYDDFKPVDPD